MHNNTIIFLFKTEKVLKEENFCEVFVENRHLYIEANFYI